MTRMSNSPTLHAAVSALAAVCDGAQEQDFRGFAGPDTSAGHYFAALPQASWGNDWEHKIWVMLRKYRRQLEGFGIDYDEIPVPAEPEVEKPRFSKWDHIAEQRAKGIDTLAKSKEREIAAARRVEVKGEMFIIIVHKYDKAGREALKAATGARFDWDTKTWRVPAHKAQAVESWAQDWQAAISPETQALFERVEAGEIEQPPDVTVRYIAETNEFVIAFGFGEHFETLRSLVKAIEGRKFVNDGQAKYWTVPAVPEAAPGLTALLAAGS
jgi:hypothetical protein